MDAIDRWLDRAAIAPSSLDPGAADVVVLGELNHFVHEKSDFRLALAPRLLELGYDVWGEELGWSDGTRIDDYLRTRDEQIFERIALFGYRGDVRGDRDDAPTGIFRESLKAYPFALMMKMNQGKTKSANVQPVQYACISGGKTALQSPGLFTRIIAAIVIPRKTSSDSR